MAANFPDSPSNGDTFTSGALTFTWNGSAWKLDPSSGTKGEKGQKGEVGVTGDKGQKGEKGEIGDKGQKGEIGATGGTGGTGSKGQKGEVGATGSAGAAAAKGQKGEVGATGSGGSTGDKGSSGDKGQKGEASTVKGDKGQKGELGTAGDKGATGSGDKGQKGEEGPQGGGAPVGQIVAWSGSAGSLPSGYFLCDGSAISRSTYAALFAIVGTTHGSGNGSSTFNIPDLRDRFVVGSSNSTGDTTYPGVSPGATGGQADAVVVSHNHSVNDPTHGHSINDPGHQHNTSITNSKVFPATGTTSISYGGPGGYPATVFTMSNATTGVVVNAAGTGISVNSNGVSGSNKNLPPYYSLAYIIQYAQGGSTAKGQKGEQGATGSGGSTGDKGQKGEAGDKGAASSVQGPTGDKGQKGEIGATGAGGSTGSAGAKGQKGEIGSTGDKGSIGVGEKGQKGEIGNTGSTGAKGQKGEVGAGGSAGSDGSDGSKGQKGDTGAQGSTGASGPATVPQIKKAENTAQHYDATGGWITRVTLTLSNVDSSSHVLVLWRGEIFAGSGSNASASIRLTGGNFAGGSTSGVHNVQNWAGFNDMVIDTSSSTSRTYTIQYNRNGTSAYFRNGYLFAMEMKPN
jgi:microcystin-dependent protein